jgi:hypothetical protein
MRDSNSLSPFTLAVISPDENICNREKEMAITNSLLHLSFFPQTCAASAQAIPAGFLRGGEPRP